MIGMAIAEILELDPQAFAASAIAGAIFGIVTV
jgi:hypothetical protein